MRRSSDSANATINALRSAGRLRYAVAVFLLVMSATGLLTWTPSRNQFNALRTSPLYVEFIAQDQPDKAETIGKAATLPCKAR